MDPLQHHRRLTQINFDGMPSLPWTSDFAATTLKHTRPAVARHYLRHWEASKAPSADIAAQPCEQIPAASKSAGRLSAGEASTQRLSAGHAITLRASQLSVLRIAHGRVWVTMTAVGPWSRVPAGDHFLSRGESLTLLPGQTLVIKSFSSDPVASAQFVWQPPGARVSALQPAPAATLRDGIRQPWLDLRHALSLALRAAGRLVHGLGRVGAAAVTPALTTIALFFVAGSAHKQGDCGTFNAIKSDSGASCRP